MWTCPRSSTASERPRGSSPLAAGLRERSPLLLALQALWTREAGRMRRAEARMSLFEDAAVRDALMRPVDFDPWSADARAAAAGGSLVDYFAASARRGRKAAAAAAPAPASVH